MQKTKNNHYPMLIEGLSTAAEQYSAMLIDAWGVLHDGGTLYPGAKACLSELQKREVPVVVISNAARRSDTVLEEILRFGIDAKSIYAAISSGEVLWQLISSGDADFSFGDCAVYYYGPDRSRSVLYGLDLNITEDITRATVIITTGCLDRVDTLDYDLPFLNVAAKLDIPMICINPDLVAIRNGVKGYSAGSVAEKYIELGASDVRWIGKPHREIYQRALALLPQVATKKVLAIGDALRTDICGAESAGLDSLFIIGGIHHDEIGEASPDQMERFFNAADAVPAYYTKGLCW